MTSARIRTWNGANGDKSKDTATNSRDPPKIAAAMTGATQGANPMPWAKTPQPMPRNKNPKSIGIVWGNAVRKAARATLCPAVDAGEGENGNPWNTLLLLQ